MLKQSILVLSFLASIGFSTQVQAADLPTCRVERNRFVLELASGRKLPITAEEFRTMAMNRECNPPATPENCEVQDFEQELGNYIHNHCRPINNSPYSYHYYSLTIGGNGLEALGTGTCFELSCSVHVSEGSATVTNYNNREYCVGNPVAYIESTKNMLEERGFCRPRN